MTPLEEEFRRRIALDGPITLGDYMTGCLSHPKYGYYMTRDPFGRGGDFTTAPEISQMFGELIGLWCAEMWRLMECPPTIHLVEMGPGRGTLMLDMLRAARRLPNFMDAVQVHLVEMSPVLSGLQRKTLGQSPVSVTWHDHIADIPEDGPVLFVANEFFDALPVRQVERTAEGWRERIVVIDPDTDQLAITCGWGASELEPMIDPELRGRADVGRVIELSPVSWRIAAEVGQRIASHGGAGLFIDYGYEGPATGDTVQAVRRHEPCGIFDDPGEADLTAHVDFTQLAQVFRDAGCAPAPLAGQGPFLQALGIDYRTNVLVEAAPHMETELRSGRDRLINADAMGKLFKVLGVKSAGLPALPGLETE
ncbi:MAG: class I SAM-dependent methyltransferase [Alphaproteobacteria bacterium]